MQMTKSTATEQTGKSPRCTAQHGPLRIVLLLGLLVLPEIGRAEKPDDDDKAWRKQIADLESRLFEPVLKADEIDALLEQLKQPEARENAAKRLVDRGQGHIERIIDFARGCEDIEARQCCADAVESLDASYRTTELGKRLGTLYREHAGALLPAAWTKFRKNPLDMRAVAMLMHADAETTYAALGKTDDRHDRVRYLLLRMRELSPDKFAADRIETLTAPGVELSLPDVFPLGGNNCRMQRVVGQTYLHVIAVSGSQSYESMPSDNPFGEAGKPGYLPRVQYIDLSRRWVNLFQAQSYGVYHWQVGCFWYNFRSVQERGGRPSVSEINEGLCPLPRLTLSREERMALIQQRPWWIKPYLPTIYHSTARFTPAKRGATAPEAVAAQFPKPDSAMPQDVQEKRPSAPLDPSAPSIAILPPMVSDAADPDTAAAAELTCDRLAEAVAAEGVARVVDRRQLDRVLQEKKLSVVMAKAAVSFDALVRLEVNVPSLVPTAQLSLIDLSHGNVMREARYDWPLQKGDLAKMADLCREALTLMGRPAKDVLKVRLLGVDNSAQNPRIAPMARRLEQVFDEAVARSPRLAAVRHLEAGSAKEESLLLLMGLSRLPGGRRFVPQADAAVELRLREGDGRGKTFEETPVEISVRVTRCDTNDDQSFVTEGTVARFDGAAVAAWEKLAGLLQEARPQAATGWFDDMAVRRRQAEAELRAAQAIVSEGSGAHGEVKVAAVLAHTEAAVKLDPTFEDAAYEYLEIMKTARFEVAKTGRQDAPADPDELFFDTALQFFERFPQSKHRGYVHDACRIVIHSSLGKLFFSGYLELTPQRLRMIQKAMQILEDAAEHGSTSLAWDYQAMTLGIVGRAMKRTGVPIGDRQQWVDSILERCSRIEAKQSKETLNQPEYLLGAHNEVWLRAAELAVEDGSEPRAKRLIAELQGRLTARSQPPYTEMFRRLRGVVVKMDDSDAVIAFDRWHEGLDKKAVEFLNVGWPWIDVFHDRKQTSRDTFQNTMPAVEGVAIRHATLARDSLSTPMSALVEGDRRLYLAMSSHSTIHWGHFKGEGSSGRPQVIVYVPLDGAGRPVGKTYRTDHPIRNNLWDSLKEMPQPTVNGPLQVLDAKFLAGKLYLGTLRDGLLVFDPKTETWTRFGPEQGLPEEGVFAIHPLDERTLFCVGKNEFRNCACFTLHLPDGRVTLLHNIKGDSRESAPRFFWRDGDKLMAWSQWGLCQDLLGRDFQFSRRSPGIPYGWDEASGRLDSNYHSGYFSFAEIDGRRFVTNTGLHEFDPTGKLIHSWWRNTMYLRESGRVCSMPLPRDCPIDSPYMVAAGPLLVFVASSPSLTAWDPKTDTWYGPLAVAGANHALGTRAGTWLGTRDGVLFVSNDNLLAAAKKAGRAMTTAEFRRRQRDAVSAMPAIARAKLAFSMHQFGEAENLLGKILQDDPNCAEALLLMGNLNDSGCLGRPDEARKFYRRLAGLKTNPNASFTGMFQETIFLQEEKRWPEALAAVEEILRTFPKLSNDRRRDLDWRRGFFQKQMAEKGAK